MLEQRQDCCKAGDRNKEPCLLVKKGDNYVRSRKMDHYRCSYSDRAGPDFYQHPDRTAGP